MRLLDASKSSLRPNQNLRAFLIDLLLRPARDVQIMYSVCKLTLAAVHMTLTYSPDPVVCQTCSHKVCPHYFLACCLQWSQTGGSASVNCRMCKRGE